MYGFNLAIQILLKDYETVIISYVFQASPKPLMQGSGPFPGMGGGPQGIGPNMPQGGTDCANPMVS